MSCRTAETKIQKTNFKKKRERNNNDEEYRRRTFSWTYRFNLYSYFSDGSEQQVYTMINHDYMVDRDGDHWIRYY